MTDKTDKIHKHIRDKKAKELEELVGQAMTAEGVDTMTQEEGAAVLTLLAADALMAKPQIYFR